MTQFLELVRLISAHIELILGPALNSQAKSFGSPELQNTEFWSCSDVRNKSLSPNPNSTAYFFKIWLGPLKHEILKPKFFEWPLLDCFVKIRGGVLIVLLIPESIGVPLSNYLKNLSAKLQFS